MSCERGAGVRITHLGHAGAAPRLDSFVVRNAGLMFPNGQDNRQTRVQSIDSYNMASDLPFTAMPNPERHMSDVELIVTSAEQPQRLIYPFDCR